jgi:xylulokinase
MAEHPAMLLGVDLGAGAMKVSLLDVTGRTVASASSHFATHSPRPGWAEQDPEDWWRALCESVPRVMAQANIAADQIQAVSFSAGTHSWVLLDEFDRVLRPAVLWSDQRSGAEAKELQERAGEAVLRIALNWPTPTWTLTQLLWLQRHEPGLASRARRLMMPKDWLRWRLCGEWHTDVTDAVGTMLWDYKAHAWSVELLDLIGWPAQTMPPVVRPEAVVGRVTAAAAALSGLRIGTPLVCGTSDTSAEAYAAGADVGGAGVIKLATAATVSFVDRQPHAHRTLINYPFAIPELWYTISATNSCASAHRWLRDMFFRREGEDGAAVFAHMDSLAAAIAPGSDGLLFHPYLLGERAPYWDPLLRGDFIGMTMRHRPGHFVRALYEGIAMSIRDVLGEFVAQDLALSRALIIGGGSQSPTWRQIVADVLGIPIGLPSRTDASVGVALLAGVGAGVFADARSARASAPEAQRWHEPDARAHARYTEAYGLYRDSARRLREIHHALSDMESRGSMS